MMAEPDSRKTHILVVEDNPADVQLLQLALHSAELDCELTVISDGESALAWIARNAETEDSIVDLAILDLNVPRNDGLEILECMRNTVAFGALPVVILTSSSSPRELARLTGLRVARHITKPLDFDEFMQVGSTVRQVLAERYRQSEQASEPRS